jgi:hypothetical protein
MHCNARTNINAAWGGAGASGVARLLGNLIVCGFGKHLRRRRSQRAFASGNVIARTGRAAFATLAARVSFRWVVRPACGHRRLTTRSSGPRSAAAYLGR